MLPSNAGLRMRGVLLAATGYLLIGVVFALPVTHVRIWRLAAWVGSALVYSAQIGYEHFQRRSSVRAIATYAGSAAAIGALALAVGAIVRRLAGAEGTTVGQAFGFAVWPIIIGIPAYLGALVAAGVLSKLAPRSRAVP